MRNCISIIIPVYNAEAYLETCVDSVLSQEHQNLEVILINDGSTDGSGEICDAFAESDDRVVVIHKKNGGVSSARNAGLDLAKGDIISFLDCDDYILPDMYGTLLEKMENAGAQIAICTVLDELEDGDVRKVDTGETMIISGRDALLNLTTKMGDKAGHRETIWFSVWNKLYDAKLFRDGIRFDPETDSAEDIPVNLAAFDKVDRILYYEKPYYFWRFRKDSQSSLMEPAALKGAARTSRYIFDYAKMLPAKNKKVAITAAVRHFYWYYTGSVYALSLAKKSGLEEGGGRGRTPDAYMLLQEDMRVSLRAIASDPDYRTNTDWRFRATVWFMLNTPHLFAAVWLMYRRLKRL